ncbi:MAG: pyridoxamine 5'-phosphate oxidase family protein, partial [Roseococcus sp.]
MTRPFYHDGMREWQDRTDGRRVADALEAHRLHREFWADDREMIEAAPFFFIATGHGEHMDCSIRAGDPGFVKILDGATLEWPEYDGNSMFRTLGNIARNPNVGLLFLRFDGQSRRIRISGTATIHGDANRVVRVACKEIYPNCPRYIPDLV